MALIREFTSRLIPRLNASSPAFHPYYAGSCVSSRGIFWRFLQQRSITQSSSAIRPAQSAVKLPEFPTLPVGDKLREELREGNLDGSGSGVLLVEDARKIVRAARPEKLKRRLRSVAENHITVSHSEFVQICADESGSRDRGLEFAKLLDETAYVVVLGDVVFPRPEQLTKSIQILISQSRSIFMARKKEPEEMEKLKAQIDKQAQAQVRTELYGGLGLMLAQTLVFVRLTFWELSGAHMPLHNFLPLGLGMHLLPPHLDGAVFRRLLPAAVHHEAIQAHQASQL